MKCWRLALCVGLLIAGLAGCATSGKYVGPRQFDFEQDTFAFANELNWVYHFDTNDRWVHENRVPPPEYEHHCFVVARSTRQFFQHARFDATLPTVDEAEYRKRVRRVISIDPRHDRTEAEKIVIPGYRNLREFSAAHGELLKAECGGAWRSYFQRGNWRMIFPLSRSHQDEMAAQLIEALKRKLPPVVHVVRFPQLTINHAVLLFDCRETTNGVEFATYDPNHPDKPTTLTFDRASRRFHLPANDYFPGGRVDVYEVYRSFWY